METSLFQVIFFFFQENIYIQFCIKLVLTFNGVKTFFRNQTFFLVFFILFQPDILKAVTHIKRHIFQCPFNIGLLVAYCSRFDAWVNSRWKIYFLSCCTGKWHVCIVILYLKYIIKKLIMFYLWKLVYCSLSAGNDHYIRCHAAVRDGTACSTLPGAFHSDNLCCGGRVQRRDEKVLDRNILWGEKNSRKK